MISFFGQTLESSKHTTLFKTYRHYNKFFASEQMFFVYFTDKISLKVETRGKKCEWS